MLNGQLSTFYVLNLNWNRSINESKSATYSFLLFIVTAAILDNGRDRRTKLFTCYQSRTVYTKFDWNWPSSSRREDFQRIGLLKSSYYKVRNLTRKTRNLFFDQISRNEQTICSQVSWIQISHQILSPIYGFREEDFFVFWPHKVTVTYFFKQGLRFEQTWIGARPYMLLCKFH